MPDTGGELNVKIGGREFKLQADENGDMQIVSCNDATVPEGFPDISIAYDGDGTLNPFQAKWSHNRPTVEI